MMARKEMRMKREMKQGFRIWMMRKKKTLHSETGNRWL
jgi:hypothetical protein